MAGRECTSRWVDRHWHLNVHFTSDRLEACGQGGWPVPISAEAPLLRPDGRGRPLRTLSDLLSFNSLDGSQGVSLLSRNKCKDPLVFGSPIR